jgi:hypothetical protein
MTAPTLATVEMAVLTWTIILATVIFSAGYLWHRLKEAFPELFRRKPKSRGKRGTVVRGARLPSNRPGIKAQE